MLSTGELYRMGFPVDAASARGPVDEYPSTNVHEEAHELAIELLANTLNMPGDNRVPINRILQRAYDADSDSEADIRTELVHTLHNILSEDECVNLAENARRSGYFREDESICRRA